MLSLISKMEMYRLINKQLTTHNQELRNAIQRFKNEILYLNRKIVEQHEIFYCSKASAEGTAEKNIYLQAAYAVQNGTNSPRAGSSSYVVYSVGSKSCSPRAGSSLSDNDTDELAFKISSGLGPGGNSRIMGSSSKDVKKRQKKSKSTLASRVSIPAVVVEEFQTPPTSPEKISKKSESHRNEDLRLQFFKDCIEAISVFDTETSETARKSDSILVTTNEEKSCSYATNETLSDSTLNCLLDAPCSTPYNKNKISNETIFKKKEARVLVKRMSEAELAHMGIKNNNCTETCNFSLKDGLIKTNNTQVEARHSENMAFNKSKCENNIAGSKISTSKEKPSSSKKKTVEAPITRSKSKEMQNKENQDSDTKFNSPDDESNVGKRQLRHKQVCLKEPSLRTKLRNTTNIKL